MLRAMESDSELASLRKEKQDGEILRAIKATAATTYTAKSKYIVSTPYLNPTLVTQWVSKRLNSQ
jgi:hypothetical protein